eukprot:SAG22_NODE_4449_length_1264_cov_1.641509_1_plen_199_part_01
MADVEMVELTDTSWADGAGEGEDGAHELELEVYRCVEVALARSGVGFGSREVDQLPIGTLVVGLELRMVPSYAAAEPVEGEGDGEAEGGSTTTSGTISMVERVRTTAGWISVRASDDSTTILEPLGRSDPLRQQMIRDYLAAQPPELGDRISGILEAAGEMTRDVVVGLVDNLVGSGETQPPVGIAGSSASAAAAAAAA